MHGAACIARGDRRGQLTIADSRTFGHANLTGLAHHWLSGQSRAFVRQLNDRPWRVRALCRLQWHLWRFELTTIRRRVTLQRDVPPTIGIALDAPPNRPTEPRLAGEIGSVGVIDEDVHRQPLRIDRSG